MILEVADIRLQPGRQTEFDEAIVHGLEQIICKAAGFKSWKVNKGVESANCYLLMIEWETLEHHTVQFRQSPAFLQWRAIVGPFFAEPPVVEHFKLCVKRVRRRWRAATTARPLIRSGLP